MLSKLLAFTVVTMVGSAALTAQTTPTAPKDKVGKRVESFILDTPFERSYLGVQTVEISKENFAKFGLAQVRGVGIEKIAENSPAANAGLQNGDVIIRFENEEVKSAAKLSRLVAEVAPDQTAKITVLRGGSEREFSVVMGKREAPQFQTGGALEQLYGLPGIPEFPDPQKMRQLKRFPPPNADDNVLIWRGAANRQIGVGVTALTKQLADYFGVSDGKGLLINDVRENSPAAKAGLKAGDVIVAVENKEVVGQADLTRAVNAKKEGDISLTIVRDRNRQTIRVTPEITKDGALKFEEFDDLFQTDSGGVNFQMRSTPPPTASLPTIPLKIAPRIL